MIFLLRYDTEGREVEEMAGFLEKAVEVHRLHDIPATFFCTGGALEVREKSFCDSSCARTRRAWRTNRSGGRGLLGLVLSWFFGRLFAAVG